MFSLETVLTVVTTLVVTVIPASIAAYFFLRRKMIALNEMAQDIKFRQRKNEKEEEDREEDKTIARLEKLLVERDNLLARRDQTIENQLKRMDELNELRVRESERVSKEHLECRELKAKLEAIVDNLKVRVGELEIRLGANPPTLPRA
jgi:membrane-associated HD superfamily phosphohydrolase